MNPILQMLQSLTGPGQQPLPANGPYNAEGLGAAPQVEAVGAAGGKPLSPKEEATVLAKLPTRGGDAGGGEGGGAGGFMRDLATGFSKPVAPSNNKWQAFSNGLSSSLGAISAAKAAAAKERSGSIKDRFNMLAKLMEMDRSQRNADRTHELNEKRVGIYGDAVKRYGHGGRPRQPNPLQEDKDIETILTRRRAVLGLDDEARKWKPGEKEALEAQFAEEEKRYRSQFGSRAGQPAPAAPPAGAAPAAPAGRVEPAIIPKEPATGAPQGGQTSAKPPAPSRDDILAEAKRAIGAGAPADAVIGRINERFGFGLTTKDLGI
jgi:hypothetical protein